MGNVDRQSSKTMHTQTIVRTTKLYLKQDSSKENELVNDLMINSEKVDRRQSELVRISKNTLSIVITIRIPN